MLFFLLSTRLATSLTFVFRSFSSASCIKREFCPSRAFPQRSTHSPATSSPCSSTQAPSALERKIFLCRRGFRQWFSSKHSTTARELRRGARSRCPRRGEEEVLRIDKDMERRALNDQPLMSVSLWGTSALFRGWRMHYSSSPSRRRHRQATDDGTAAALHSQGHRRCTSNTEHFGEHQTMEKRKIYSWFSTRTMEHSPFRIPWQPARSPVSMATLCFELGDSLPQSTSLSFAVGFGPGDAAEEL